MVTIVIDDREYEAPEGATVLETARQNGIHIPTMCYHPALKPTGACKLCAVEVAGRTGKHIAMLSCILRVKSGLVVKTHGDLVTQARTKAFKNLLRMAPQSKKLLDLASDYGIDPGPPPDGCIRCRLCVRVCNEIVGPGALKMEKRNGNRYVVPIKGRCIGCGTCANICPTGDIKLEDKENVRTLSIRDEIIGKHPLERCEGCGKFFATPGFLKHTEKRTYPHPDVKDHHRYCQTCAKLFSNRITKAATPKM